MKICRQGHVRLTLHGLLPALQVELDAQEVYYVAQGLPEGLAAELEWYVPSPVCIW